MSKEKPSVKIGGASGFWGDAAIATSQLLGSGDLDFLVYDYLAEITMSILARTKAKKPAAGYALDFVTSAMVPNLKEIASQGIRVISNAGGLNPLACADALRRVIGEQGLELKVAVVTGDDLMVQIDDICASKEIGMFSNVDFPEKDCIGSINAYLGAYPIAAALGRGADIVVTGRCVDSAVTLAACIHAFGWSHHSCDLLSAGSLAGHILECGPQATGGNFTDWESIEGGFEDIGYPILEIFKDGSSIITKPKGTGGLVSTETVCEQMLYEIADPQSYILPDVICDFSQVKLKLIAKNQVQISGAKGRLAPDTYKVCLTFRNGYRGGHFFGFYGIDAEKKANAYARAALVRSRRALAAINAVDFTQTDIEVIGAEAQFGEMRQSPIAREVAIKIGVCHPEARGVDVFLKEATGLSLSAPPGLSGFAGARPKPSPVWTLFSFLIDKADVVIHIDDDMGSTVFDAFQPDADQEPPMPPMRPTEPAVPNVSDDLIDVPLIRIALARSGDKGDNANVGVIARKPEYLPFLWHGIDQNLLDQVFGHFVKGSIEKYLLPGSNSVNLLLNNALGGGGTSSLRQDPQGKGYSQLLLAATIKIPADLLEE
ncbi:DUF1446 domain-containing protein [Paracoccaceae bacterium]|nr:DUF1446 domain-containing protein [Paracoccaceae bacterium]